MGRAVANYNKKHILRKMGHRGQGDDDDDDDHDAPSDRFRVYR